MILCDFLSRIEVDDGDPLDLVPITYNVLALLCEAYKHISDNYLVVTSSQRAKAGLPAPPSVHGVTKGVNLNLKPETQALRVRANQTPKTPRVSTPNRSLAHTSQGTPKNPFYPKDNTSYTKGGDSLLVSSNTISCWSQVHRCQVNK